MSGQQTLPTCDRDKTAIWVIKAEAHKMSQRPSRGGRKNHGHETPLRIRRSEVTAFTQPIHCQQLLSRSSALILLANSLDYDCFQKKIHPMLLLRIRVSIYGTTGHKIDLDASTRHDNSSPKFSTSMSPDDVHANEEPGISPILKYIVFLFCSIIVY